MTGVPSGAVRAIEFDAIAFDDDERVGDAAGFHIDQPPRVQRDQGGAATRVGSRGGPRRSADRREKQGRQE